MIPKERFTRFILAKALRVPVAQCHNILKNYRELLLSIPRKEKVVALDDPGHKLVLFDPDTAVPEALQAYPVQEHQVQLTYDDLTAEQVLKEILPAEVTVPTGFETVGHIAHFNLLPEQMPYKELIGQVTVEVGDMQKTPNIRTAITKLEKLNNVYRNYALEVIGGEPDLVTTIVRTS